MKTLIDTISGMTTAGFASGGSSTDNPALPANAPFTLRGEPDIRYVTGENPDPDFIEVVSLGNENGSTNIYQCEAKTSGKFSSQWYKITATDSTALSHATYVKFTTQAASTAPSPVHYPRTVKTGSHTLHGSATPGTSSSTDHSFQLSGRGSNIRYTQPT